jgi:hypothetical protein
MPDGSEIPYVPRDVNELDWAQTDWTYTYAGPIRAGAWGAFDPHDELVDQTLAFLAAGIPKDKGYYLQLLNDSFAHPTSDRNFLDVFSILIAYDASDFVGVKPPYGSFCHLTFLFPGSRRRVSRTSCSILLGFDGTN